MSRLLRMTGVILLAWGILGAFTALWLTLMFLVGPFITTAIIVVVWSIFCAYMATA